jgi:hybrid cluster-associated redox disulfide protein
MMEALQADPRAREVFAAHGMGCVGCMGVSMESIEDGAKMHGIDPEVVLAELNGLTALAEDQSV